MKKIKKINFILYILLIFISRINPRLEKFTQQTQLPPQQVQYNSYNNNNQSDYDSDGSNYDSDGSDDYTNDNQSGGLQQDPTTGLYTDGQGNYFYDDQGTQPVSASDMQQIQAMMAGGDPSQQGPQTFTQKADNLANEIMGFWGVQAVFILGMTGIEVGEIPHWVKNQYGTYELKKYVGKNLQGDIMGNQAEVEKFVEFSKKNPQLIQQEMNKKPQETADIYKGIMKLDQNNSLKQKFLKDLEENPTFFKAVTSLDNELAKKIITENPDIFDSMARNNSSQYDEIMNQKSMQNLEIQAKDIKQNKNKEIPTKENFKKLEEQPLVSEKTSKLQQLKAPEKKQGIENIKNQYNKKIKDQQIDANQQYQKLQKKKEEYLKQKNNIDISHQKLLKEYNQKAENLKNSYQYHKNNAFYNTEKTNLQENYLPKIKEHLNNASNFSNKIEKIQNQQKKLQQTLNQQETKSNEGHHFFHETEIIH